MLNKLTIDNLEKLSAKVLEVEIVEQKTLEGLTDQIFDRAVIETGFCEMYAQLCSRLANSKDANGVAILPTFDNPDSPTKRIDFRRLLLNKCQNEFEKGVVSNKAQARIDEGAARRRMLGNMQFIGLMYKHDLLTERIMHNCVLQLLIDDQTPRTEDIECLCQLLNMVGGKLDAQKTKAEFKERLSTYFDRMKRLTENVTLEGRIRFMVQDVLDLRNRKWQPLRKISEVHQDAADEMSLQSFFEPVGPHAVAFLQALDYIKTTGNPMPTMGLDRLSIYYTDGYDPHDDPHRLLRGHLLSCIEPGVDGTMPGFSPTTRFLQTYAKGWKVGPITGRLQSNLPPPLIMVMLPLMVLSSILDSLLGTDMINAMSVCSEWMTLIEGSPDFHSKVLQGKLDADERSAQRKAHWRADDDDYGWAGFGRRNSSSNDSECYGYGSN